MYSTKLFAEQVMPKLKHLFPDHASDGRFWCKPLAKQAVPGSLPHESEIADRIGVPA